MIHVRLGWLFPEVLLTIGASLAVATPTFGQGLIPAVIGATVGNETARQIEKAERICMSGVALLTPELAEVWLRKPRGLMTAYLAAPASVDNRSLGKYFIETKTGGVWDRAGGLQANGSLANPLASATSESVPIYAEEALILNGDSWSARGAWKAKRHIPGTQDADESLTYVADFIRERTFGRWGIWRIRIYGASEVPEPPVQVCHLKLAKQLW